MFSQLQRESVTRMCLVCKARDAGVLPHTFGHMFTQWTDMAEPRKAIAGCLGQSPLTSHTEHCGVWPGLGRVFAMWQEGEGSVISDTEGSQGFHPSRLRSQSCLG